MPLWNRTSDQCAGRVTGRTEQSEAEGGNAADNVVQSDFRTMKTAFRATKRAFLARMSPLRAMMSDDERRGVDEPLQGVDECLRGNEECAPQTRGDDESFVP